MLGTLLCAMVLSGPADVGRAPVRRVVSVTVSAVVKAPVAVAKAVRNRPHRAAKIAKAILPPYRR